MRKRTKLKKRIAACWCGKVWLKRNNSIDGGSWRSKAKAKEEEYSWKRELNTTGL